MSRTVAGLSIRSATERDIDAVLWLWRAAATVPTVSDTPDALASLLELDPDALVLAESGGAVVGSVIVVDDDFAAIAFWTAYGLTRQNHRARLVRDL
jgi:ribosomal protein S18 acetylase RimI-like enzyme